MTNIARLRPVLCCAAASILLGGALLSGCAAGRSSASPGHAAADGNAHAAADGSAQASGVAGKHKRAGKRGGNANASGVFFVNCVYSHTANDDPIVMPGMTNMSMLHDFFGNTATNATSTPSSLRGGSTTCETSVDPSAYWTPVLYANGQELRPTTMATYWHAASSTGNTPDLPANMEMIAGDAHATTPQPLSHIAWLCHADRGPKGSRSRGKKTQAPHVCDANQHIKEEITFPNCWDGTTSTTKIAPEHIVYADSAGTCPSDHPLHLLTLRLNVMYPNPVSTNSGVTFALSTAQGHQGSTNTAHADFVDAWSTSAIDRLVSTCLDAHVKCGKVTGAAGTPNGLQGHTNAKNSKKSEHAKNAKHR